MSRAWYLDLLSSLLVGVLLCLPAAVLALLFFVLAQAPVRLLLGLIVFPKSFAIHEICWREAHLCRTC